MHTAAQSARGATYKTQMKNNEGGTFAKQKKQKKNGGIKRE